MKTPEFKSTLLKTLLVATALTPTNMGCDSCKKNKPNGCDVLVEELEKLELNEAVGGG